MAVVMEDIAASLYKNKYALLKSVIDRQYCDQLAKFLADSATNKLTWGDEQCPKSEAIYGAAPFDALLAELTPLFSRITGKELFPTYSYARLYARGEELKNHVDRESCEISATITLGFDGDVWPIYMGDSMEKDNAFSISMEIGDAVLYFGIEKHHWREVYTEGKWQAQVFLHYVDADGPHKEWAYDKRGKLNLS
jgi:hypothetical protein